MKIEIDQSGKIEKTNKHTFLAYSNGSHSVLKISSVEKQKVQRYLRAESKSNLFIYLTFASLIIILLKDLKEKDIEITIDIEYPGRSIFIKNLIRTI